MKTSSRLGLSGAPRTSSTVNPAPTRDSATSDRLRKRRTESETTVVPGSRKTTCWRKATNAMATSISSVQLFTNPTLGDQPAERSGLGSMHASLRRLGHESRRHESTTREEPRAVLLEVTTRHLRSRRPEPHASHRYEIRLHRGNVGGIAMDPAHSVGERFAPGYRQRRCGGINACDLDALLLEQQARVPVAQPMSSVDRTANSGAMAKQEARSWRSGSSRL